MLGAFFNSYPRATCPTKIPFFDGCSWQNGALIYLMRVMILLKEPEIDQAPKWDENLFGSEQLNQLAKET